MSPGRPPTGLARLGFRLPILLYRAHLGWLLGGRFLLLEHTGRRSGLLRRTVLEVVEHDPLDGSYVVAAGFGPGSDWYRNLLARPEAAIRVGPRHLEALAGPLTPAAGAGVMERYAQRHPFSAAQLSRLMGYPTDGSRSAYRRIGEEVPFLRLAARVPGNP